MTAGHAAWTAAAGQSFTATTQDGASHGLTLTRVSDATAAGGWVSYTLTFAAALDAPAEQQTYALAGPGIAEDVFLVPSARSDDALTLEAVFAQPEASAQPEEAS